MELTRLRRRVVTFGHAPRRLAARGRATSASARANPGRPARYARSAAHAAPLFALTPPSPARPEIRPLSSDRYVLKLSISQAIHDKLLQAQALVRHRLPSGDLEVVLDRALDALLDSVRRDRFGRTTSPRPAGQPRADSRHVPNATTRAVVARDGEQCSFVDETGHRCEERGRLELDHRTPRGKGGSSDEDQMRVLCRFHNQHAARKEYGEEFMRRKIAEAQAGRET